jgi:hypothetical protein
MQRMGRQLRRAVHPSGLWRPPLVAVQLGKARLAELGGGVLPQAVGAVAGIDRANGAASYAHDQAL